MKFKKIKENMKKHDVIIMIILMGIISSGYVFYNYLCSGDEFLLLNHTLKMYNRKIDI